MVAWRARVGLIKPTHRGKSFAYWYNHAPEGVEIVPTFIGFRSEQRESFLEGFKKAEELAVQLKDVGCDIISVSGTPPFLLKGLEFERQWAAKLSEKIGLPVVTPMEPHAIALKALGARRVAVATYYGHELNQAIVNYFAKFAIQSELMPGLSMTGELGPVHHFTDGARRSVACRRLSPLQEVAGKNAAGGCRLHQWWRLGRGAGHRLPGARFKNKSRLGAGGRNVVDLSQIEDRQSRARGRRFTERQRRAVSVEILLRRSHL
jgi:Arylmalonate decarboxylase